MGKPPILYFTQKNRGIWALFVDFVGRKALDNYAISLYNCHYKRMIIHHKEEHTMKKIISAILALTMIFALCACGGSKEAAPAEVKTLKMGTNAAFPPYEFISDEDGETIVGIDAEIAGAIAAKLGMKLEIIDMEFGSIITSVQTGKIDIGMAGMTVTEERLQNVNFSETYAKGIQSVIVPDGSPIASVDDLGGKMIGVQESTTGHIYAEGDYGAENVTAYATGASAVEALKAGKVDCVIIDNEPAKAFVAANEGLKILETAYAEEDYAIAIAKDNEQLLKDVNKALAELTADGTVAQIIAKYISAE